MKTDSLLLTPLTREDYDYLCALYGDAEVMRWIATGKPRTPEVSIGILDKMIVAAPPQGYWVMRDNVSNERLGAAMLMIRAEGKPLELGFMLGRNAWGRGLATQAAQAVTQYALTLVDRLEAYTAIENTASQSVLRKVGFTDLGEKSGPYGGIDRGFAITRA
jgi:[ribosomal protein S5]-alanine N-acetyltransferase